MDVNIQKYVVGCVGIYSKQARIAAANELARYVRIQFENAAETRDSDALEDIILSLDAVVREITSMWRDMPQVLNVNNVDIPSGGSS